MKQFLARAFLPLVAAHEMFQVLANQTAHGRFMLGGIDAGSLQYRLVDRERNILHGLNSRSTAYV
jgi:hypothetical protein